MNGSSFKFQGSKHWQTPARTRGFRFWNCLLLLALGTWTLSAAENHPLLTAWLNAQTNIQTWSADFVQTRKLKSLTQPLTANGHVWFAAPENFRWELGHPPQTIAVRSDDVMRVIYPRLKRAEIYPLAQAGQWRAALALLQAGFPRSEAEMESQYNLLSVTMSNEVAEVTLQPKSSAARRMMPQIMIGFSTNNFVLRSTELEFADGSIMRNDFSNPELNVKIEPGFFNPPLGPEFKIVEPLKPAK